MLKSPSIARARAKTEQELADFYQAHKDNLDMWEPVETPPFAIPRGSGRSSQRLRATITVRFTPEETAIVHRVAEREDIPFTEVVRRAVRAYGERLGSDPQSTERAQGASVRSDRGILQGVERNIDLLAQPDHFLGGCKGQETEKAFPDIVV